MRFAPCMHVFSSSSRKYYCPSPDFIIYMSNNPSSNCCRCLWRLVVPYKGETAFILTHGKILARLIILQKCKRNGHKLARSCKILDCFCKMCQILAGLTCKFLARTFCMAPSRHSCRTWNPLLWVLITIPASRLSRYS